MYMQCFRLLDLFFHLITCLAEFPILVLATILTLFSFEEKRSQNNLFE